MMSDRLTQGYHLNMCNIEMNSGAIYSMGKALIFNMAVNRHALNHATECELKYYLGAQEYLKLVLSIT